MKIQSRRLSLSALLAVAALFASPPAPGVAASPDGEEIGGGVPEETGSVLASTQPTAVAGDARVIDLRHTLRMGERAAAGRRSEWDNDSAAVCIGSLTAAHVANELAALVVSPPFDFLPTLGAFIAHLGLKHCAPVVIAPPTLDFSPNTPDGCGYDVLQKTRVDDITDSFGIPFDPLRFVQSGLGVPLVAHYNSEVRVRLQSHTGVGRADGWIRFPVGHNSVTWRGHTMLSPVDGIFIYIPKFPRRYEYLEPMVKVAVEVGLASAEEVLLPSKPYSNYFNDQYQSVRIWDDVPPTINASQAYFELEADAPGGMRSRDLLPILRPTFTVSDKCNRPVKVNHYGVAPLVPVDQNTSVRWWARDPGPNSATKGPNETVLTQTVRIVDTTPPLLEPPVDLVTESPGPTALSLGAPKVFDIADLDVQVSNDAPATYPLGVTIVTWTATDASDNRSEATQRVTVKTPGSNNAPMADDQTGADPVDAVSFEPLEITLTGFDADADHLDFGISTFPPNGDLLVPLLPYFVSDYRIEKTADRDELQAYCDRREQPPTDFVHEPTYITVLDDGSMYVLDKYYRCSQGDLVTDDRIALFAANGDLVDQRTDVNSGIRTLSISPLGEVYYTLKDRLRIFTPDLSEDEVLFLDGPTPGFPPWSPNDYGNTAIDSQGVLHVTDRNYIRSFDRYDLIRDNTPRFLGQVADSSIFNEAYDLTVDAEDSLYVSDRASDRIVRFEASQHTAGGFIPGALVGWVGRCTDGTGCDIANQRSLGYSCTDHVPGSETCTVVGSGSGSQPGQFYRPLGIAMDPNGNLYVADSGNDRVQRLTPEGYFGGQTQAADRANGFVLGAFDSVQDISVNSEHFYLLDKDQDLLHIFETTPIKELGEDWAKVDYRADNNFVGTDFFEFDVTDGLDTSAPARVNVRVTRNFRAPFAVGGIEATTLEDLPTLVELLGSDPDVPLDSLTYEVSRQPSFGTVTDSGGSGSQRKLYSPDRDFNGVDTFEFTVSDGLYTSASATVTVVVEPANDPPAVELEDAYEVGTGFPLALNARVFDPDEEDSHTVNVTWGDGVVESEGSIDEDGNIQGPLLIEGPDGEGSVLASHVYETTSAYQLTVCVTDDGGDVSLSDCASAPVVVTPMADVAFSLEPAEDRAQLVRAYTVTIANNYSPVETGLRATGVHFTHTVGKGATLLTTSVGVNGCSISSQTVTCDFAALEIGQTVELALEVELISIGIEDIPHRTQITANEPDAVPSSNYLFVEAGILIATFEGGDLAEFTRAVP